MLEAVLPQISLVLSGKDTQLQPGSALLVVGSLIEALVDKDSEKVLQSLRPLGKMLMPQIIPSSTVSINGKLVEAEDVLDAVLTWISGLARMATKMQESAGGAGSGPSGPGLILRDSKSMMLLNDMVDKLHALGLLPAALE